MTVRIPQGVVVVGFVGGDPDETAHLINCIIDSNAFGSGRLGRELCPHSRGVEDARDRKRRIRYYHDEERGMIFSQFCSPRSLRRLEEGVSMMGSGCGGLGDVLEEGEAEDLKEMLVMFTMKGFKRK
ncbi:hypothetical protein QJS10_CPB18g01794 [Acorus calamus]|uniref:Nonsense-mediated mRNA decay factor SMG8 n=1 Tax=Acorus calamus TaxID=4465 RepID=A0AAV9CK46_ACOCL|nr:hypothetical protein QJS10_CPB18g01794 [Acorus calamus]